VHSSNEFAFQALLLNGPQILLLFSVYVSTALSSGNIINFILDSVVIKKIFLLEVAKHALDINNFSIKDMSSNAVSYNSVKYSYFP
jgi:hypothetical protein